MTTIIGHKHHQKQELKWILLKRHAFQLVARHTRIYTLPVQCKTLWIFVHRTSSGSSPHTTEECSGTCCLEILNSSNAGAAFLNGIPFFEFPEDPPEAVVKVCFGYWHLHVWVSSHVASNFLPPVFDSQNLEHQSWVHLDSDVVAKHCGFTICLYVRRSAPSSLGCFLSRD